MAAARVVGRVSVRVMPDTSRFKKDLQKSLERLERVLEVKIPTSLNTKGLAEEGVRAKQRLQEILGSVDTRVNVDTKRAEVEIGRAARDRTATIKANVDGLSLARARKALDGLLSSIGKTAKKGLVFTTIAAGISTLGAAAASSVLPVLQLSAALAPAAGILTAIPGAIGIAVAAFATLRLALVGVGDAFKFALGKDTEAFKESLKELSPAARSVAIELHKLRPVLLGIQQVAQNALFRPLRGELTATAKALNVPLRSSFKALGTEIGLAGREVLRFARSTESIKGLQSIFFSASRALSFLRPAIQPLLAGFRDLALVGARFLASLTPAIGAAAAAFGRFLSTAARGGQATAWMNNALAVLQQLFRIIGNVGSIISSVFKAASASGGGLLGTIEKLTGQFAAFLKSTEGVKALKAIFSGIGEIGKALGPVIIALGQGLGSIAPSIGRIATLVGPILTKAINALAPALTKLEPGITALIVGLGGAFEAIAPALPAVAQALSDIAIALAPVLPALGYLVAQLAGGLAAAISQLVSSGALPQLVTAVIQFGLALGGGLTDALIAITPYLPALVMSLSELLITLTPLIPEMTKAAIALAPMIPVLTDMITQVTQLTRDVLPGFIFFIQSTVMVTEDLVTVVKNSWFLISDAIKFYIDKVNKVIDGLGDLAGKFGGWFKGAKDSAVKKLGELVDWCKGLGTRIKNGLGDLGGLLYRAGQNVLQGLINGIVSKFNSLINTARSAADIIRRVFPFSPAKDGPLKTHPMDQAGRNVASMLADGMLQGESLVARASSRLAGAAVLSPAMASAAGSGGGAGSDHQPLADAIVRAFGRAGITIQVDKRVLAEVVSRELGQQTQLRRRTN